MVRKLSILIPVYNEAGTIDELLRRVLAVRFPIERELVVVDDGSTDGSRQMLARSVRTLPFKLIEHEMNMGKGAAIQTALKHATGDVVVVQDADLELDPSDLPNLLEPIRSGQADVCYGSRFLNGLPVRYRLKATYWANRLLNALSNRINGLRITDFNTGYKMMTTAVLSRIAITQSGFEMESEITGKLARLGLKIVERPVRYTPRSVRAGKKIRFTDVFRYVQAMIRYRFLWAGDVPGAANAATVKPDWVSA